MVKHSFLSFAFLIVVSTVLIGQNDTTKLKQPELDSGTITNQFDYILTKSRASGEFQLIRKTSLLKVRDHVLDSLKTIRENLTLANQSTPKFELKISALEKEIDELKLKKENQSVSENINENINNSNFSNSSLNKTSYNLIFYCIIFVLLLLLVITAIRFKNYRSKTNKTSTNIVEIESEFDSYRKNAMKKEQELMRKLQDEINKTSN